jgi:5-methyltetrahydropteroyltriglutamate--homocysteine methyltransferase
MGLPTLPTQEIGSFRKPEYLLEKYRGYLSGSLDKGELDMYIKRASKETIKLFEDVGLDIIWDGEMHRWEMYFHPVENISGIDFVGQVRVFDNRYFIKAAVRDEVGLLRNYHYEETKFIKGITRKPLKLPITGPYTLADWSFNEYYISKYYSGDVDFAEASRLGKRDLCIDIAKKIINPILQEIEKLGVFRIQLDEPAATTHPSEMDIFVEAFNEAVRGIRTIVTTHICYSNYRVLIPYMCDLRTSQFTLEFANRDKVSLGISDDDRPGYNILKEIVDSGYSGEIGLGVIDVHTDFIEPVELIAERIRYALKYVPEEKLFINPDCGLRTRSRDVGRKKLENMVKAVGIIRKELGLV